MEGKRKAGDVVYVILNEGVIHKTYYGAYIGFKRSFINVIEPIDLTLFATELEAIQWLKAKAQRNEDEYNQRNSNGNDHD